MSATAAIMAGSVANAALGSSGTIGKGDRKVAADYLRSAPGMARNALGLDDIKKAGYTWGSRYQRNLGKNSQMPVADRFSYGGRAPTYSNNAPLPGMGNVPRYQAQGGELPDYQSQGNFNFNLQEDPGYQFARDEALRAVTRQQNAGGNALSGNKLAALQDRAAGVASQYANDAFNRQLAGSRENYGRGVTDYGIGNERANNLYSRGVNDYGINRQRESDIYQRGVDRSNTQYGRGLTDYDILRQAEQEQYGRATNQYGFDVSRNQDMYGRNENRLNRMRDLQSRSDQFRTMDANNIQNALAGMANIRSGMGAAQMGQGQFQAQSLNNAIQGGIQNSLLDRYLSQQSPNGITPAQANYLQNPQYGGGR